MNYPISSQESTREEGGVGVEVQKLQRFNEIFFISSLNSNSNKRSWLNILDHRRYGNGLSVFPICLQSVSGPLTSSRLVLHIVCLPSLLSSQLQKENERYFWVLLSNHISSKRLYYGMGMQQDKHGRASPFTTQNEWMTKEHSQRTTYYHKA